MIIFHLAGNERKNQIYMNLEVSGDKVTVLNEEQIQRYIFGEAK